jgi:hypothetical protein
MYKKYGAIKTGDNYTFTLYAPNAEEVKLIINGESILMTKDSDDFFAIYAANHMDSYYYIIDGVEKFDPFVRYTTDGYESRVYDSKYTFVNDKVERFFNDDTKILEFYMPLTKGNTYKEKAEYIKEKILSGNYTHAIIMPIQHHWYVGSLGYQAQGFFAPSSFYGEPDDLKEMIDILHGENISVILDMPWWSSTESPGIDDLIRYDGTDIYLKKDKNESFGSYYFNFESQYVKEFIKSSFEFWLDEYRFDGLRLDGINEVALNQNRDIIPEMVSLINYLTEDRENIIMLEFINKRSLSEHGFNAKYHDGILLAFMLDAYLKLTRDGDLHKEEYLYSELLEEILKRQYNVSSINHDLFIRGNTLVKVYDDFYKIGKSYMLDHDIEREKETLFILKFIYALRYSTTEFAHIDEYFRESLYNDYEEFKNYVDSIWSDPVVTETSIGFDITYGEKTIKFDILKREIEL